MSAHGGHGGAPKGHDAPHGHGAPTDDELDPDEPRTPLWLPLLGLSLLVVGLIYVLATQKPEPEPAAAPAASASAEAPAAAPAGH